ncbi:unnamed protein product, partial [Rotaria sp. Silwood2]
EKTLPVLTEYQPVRILGQKKKQIPPTLTTPSLPEESQTTEDLINKV